VIFERPRETDSLEHSRAFLGGCGFLLRRRLLLGGWARRFWRGLPCCQFVHAVQEALGVDQLMASLTASLKSQQLLIGQSRHDKGRGVDGLALKQRPQQPRGDGLFLGHVEQDVQDVLQADPLGAEETGGARTNNAAIDTVSPYSCTRNQ
jgi:hypothetical protein